MGAGNTTKIKTVHRHSDRFGKAMKVFFTLLISAGLIFWLFTKIDLHQIMDIIHRGVRYEFIFGMMATTTLSHIIRGIRWGIQLGAAGVPRMSVTAESVSIFGAYALNLIFPFAGEAWRCVYISRREHVRLDTVIGTDFGDRASDGIVIAILIGICVWVAGPLLDKFLDHYAVGASIERLVDHAPLYIVLGGVLLLLILLDYLLRRKPFVQKINASLLRTWRGFAVLFHMKRAGEYLWLTLGIWVCYFLNTYLCFFAFPFTRELITAPGSCLGLVPGLVVFVFGSCSMIVPSNGGLGPWNLAVMFALSLYGISDNDAGAYALLCWSFQAIILVVLGIYSAIYIMTYRRRQRQ